MPRSRLQNPRITRNAGETNVDQATHTVADPRASHYWDTDGYLVHAYDQTLHLGEDAWDVYLIYPPGVRWDGPQPPAPAYWMTQLSGTDAPYLDKAVFAQHTRTLLDYLTGHIRRTTGV